MEKRYYVTFIESWSFIIHVNYCLVSKSHVIIISVVIKRGFEGNLEHNCKSKKTFIYLKATLTKEIYFHILINLGFTNKLSTISNYMPATCQSLA